MMMRLWQQSMISMARNDAMKNFMQNRATMSELAMRFVGGKDMVEAVQKSQALKSKQIHTSLFYLGEYVEDLAVVNETVAALKTSARSLAESNLEVHISVDPTQIGHQIEEKICWDNAFAIAKEIKQATYGENDAAQNFLMLDMEDSSVTEATINLYDSLTDTSLPAAITLQAYLFRTERDLQKIIRNGGAVRLVKGAFAEGKELAYTNHADIDANFMKLAALMLSDEARQSGFYPIFATHDDQLIDQIITMAESQGWQKEAYEFEMLYGVRVELQEDLVHRGEKLRLYLPFGKDWWPYAVRRVGESPKNAKFLIRSLFAT